MSGRRAQSSRNALIGTHSRHRLEEHTHDIASHALALALAAQSTSGSTDLTGMQIAEPVQPYTGGQVSKTVTANGVTTTTNITPSDAPANVIEVSLGATEQLKDVAILTPVAPSVLEVAIEEHGDFRLLTQSTHFDRVTEGSNERFDFAPSKSLHTGAKIRFSTAAGASLQPSLGLTITTDVLAET